MTQGEREEPVAAWSIVERFVALWEASGIAPLNADSHAVAASEPPDVFAFLGESSEASPAVRMAVVLIDQRERWRRDRGRPAEEYLGAFADLGDDPVFREELVRGELRARRERGEPEDPRALATRFPWLKTSADGPPAPGTWDSTKPGEDLPIGLRDTAPDVRAGFGLDGAVHDALAPTRDGRDAPSRRGDVGDDRLSLAFELDESLAVESGVEDAAAGLNRTSRFTMGDRLGAGGMGVVYEAFDHERGERVALKTMRKIDPAGLYLFKEEFRALVDLSHPNLVSLYELFAVGAVWFFTMELVPGADFIRYVREASDGRSPTSGRGDETGVCDGRPDGRRGAERVRPAEPLTPSQVARLRHAVRQLAEGVAALHHAGKLHRDIKPTNVLVTADGRVVLLDFGLTAEMEHSGLHHAVGGRVVGTAGYMSPEQSGGQAVSAASDWYSMGVMLYEALTGLLPFDGPALEVIEQKQRRDPPPPSEVVAGVPDDLNALCMDLLQRDPASRPSGASVLARVSAEPLAGRPRDWGVPARSGRAALIGRERHREVLNGAFAEVKAGRSVFLFVSGRPGSGKTTLLQSFLGEVAEKDDAVVLAGRCHERESVPFKALDGVIDALSRFLMLLPESEVAALLPRDVALLARMFPVLQRVEAVAAAPAIGVDTADRREMRRRAVAALRGLLAAIGRRGPLVVAIDDLQWGDPENAALIEEVVRGADAPVMLMIGAYRTDDARTSPLIRALLNAETDAGTLDGAAPQRRELAVGPLTNAEARGLALALLGRNDAAARADAHIIARESRGNPFFIDELVKHVQSGGELHGGGSPAGHVTLDEVLWRRVARLPEPARRLLEVIAISGRPVNLADACQAAGIESECRTASAAVRAARLARWASQPLRDGVETFHDWVRETVVAHLSAEVVAGHHLRLAQVLESGGRADAETLAVHYQRGDRPDRAAELYLGAADKAVSALAFSHAAKLYRLALELRPAVGEAEAVALRTRLGDALTNGGRGREAAVEYLAASDAAPTAAALELKRRAAMQLLISGHVDEGFAVLGTVLKARGMSMPATPSRALLTLTVRRVWVRARGFHFTPRDATQVAAETLSLIDLCWSAGAGLSIIDPIRGADFQTRGLLLALRAGEPYRVARALAMEASTVALAGRPAVARVAALLARAEAVGRPLGNPHVEGLLDLARGLAALMAGRWSDAWRGFARAEPVFRDRCTGVTWELDTVHNLSLWALTFLGDLVELQRRWPVFLREAHERGDLYAATTLNTYCMVLLRLADDDPEAARDELDAAMIRWSRRGYHVQHSSALRARVAIALYRGEAESAWRMIRDEWPSFRRSLQTRIPFIRVQMLDLRARCALAASDVSGAVQARLREAERDARALERERVAWAAAHAALIRAGVAARRGDRPRAAAFFRAAIAGYDAAGMRLNAAAARRRAGLFRGGESGQTLVAEADVVLAAQNVRDLSAFVSLFAPGSSDVGDRSSTSDSLTPVQDPQRLEPDAGPGSRTL